MAWKVLDEPDDGDAVPRMTFSWTWSEIVSELESRYTDIRRAFHRSAGRHARVCDVDVSVSFEVGIDRDGHETSEELGVDTVPQIEHDVRRSPIGDLHEPALLGNKHATVRQEIERGRKRQPRDHRLRTEPLRESDLACDRTKPRVVVAANMTVELELARTGRPNPTDDHHEHDREEHPYDCPSPHRHSSLIGY